MKTLLPLSLTVVCLVASLGLYLSLLRHTLYTGHVQALEGVAVADAYGETRPAVDVDDQFAAGVAVVRERQDRQDRITWIWAAVSLAAIVARTLVGDAPEI